MKTKTYLPLRLAGLALVTLCAMVGVTSAPGADLPRTYVATYTPTDVEADTVQQAASTNTSNPVIIDVRRHPSVAIAISGQLTATNPAAATLTIPVVRSVDGTLFEDTAVTSLILTFNGTQLKTWGTNMNVGDFGYIKLLQWQNTATNIATNIVIKVVGKPPWALTYPYAGP
jgi:hypothetical protein